MVDPDGCDDDADARHAERGASSSGLPDGMRRLDALFDVLGGEEFDAEHRRLEQRLYDHDLAELRATHGDDAPRSRMRRSSRQRRLDALVEMARRSARRDVPGAEPRLLVSVLVGLETLTGPVLETFNRRQTIAPADLARVLDRADIERVVFDGPSRVIDMGRRQRLFKGAGRRAVQIRDRECFHPYCDHPSADCQIDHDIPWSHGGPTDTTNGRPGCDSHNRARPESRPPPGPAP